MDRNQTCFITKRGKSGGLRDKEANKKDQFNYNLYSSHELLKENFAIKDGLISFVPKNPSH
jgi:hypothetical protein